MGPIVWQFARLLSAERVGLRYVGVGLLVGVVTTACALRTIPAPAVVATPVVALAPIVQPTPRTTAVPTHLAIRVEATKAPTSLPRRTSSEAPSPEPVPLASVTAEVVARVPAPDRRFPTLTATAVPIRPGPR